MIKWWVHYIFLKWTNVLIIHSDLWTEQHLWTALLNTYTHVNQHIWNHLIINMLYVWYLFFKNKKWKLGFKSNYERTCLKTYTIESDIEETIHCKKNTEIYILKKYDWPRKYLIHYRVYECFPVYKWIIKTWIQS